jgi:multiple sugar transport system substrate-binding protein
VFGFEDRLIAVSTASRNGASAFKLITWLASPEISTQLARAGNATMPVRRSLVSSSAWYDAGLNSDDRAKLAEALTRALSGEKCLLVPRIPGVDEYMTALDTAVKASLVDKAPAKAALQKAAERWEQLTDRYGRDSQRQAYWKHLGISE